jgi:cytohesin
VKQFLKDGTDVNAKGRYGRTPLHLAAGHGSKEMIEFLIANGADVNAMNHDETPLDSHWSFGLKEPTERSALLRKHGGKTGAELSIVIAANRRELKTVQQYIANGVDVNTTHDGVTALHHAVSNRDRKLVQYLIDNGANVNARDESGSTPLEWCEGDKRTSDILRKHGGKTSNELDNKKPEGKPAEDIAMQKKMEQESLLTALFTAAFEGNVDMLKQHLEDGAEVNHPGLGYGMTPLAATLAGGHLAASKLLIEKGANVNAIVDGGGNLLFFIAPSGKEDLVELLLKNGAKVNHTNKHGKTPLDEAIRDPKIADLLRKHGGKTGEELKAEGK